MSDRLHEELTKSFIDKRASILARGLKQDTIFDTKIINNKKVIIDDQFIGELRGLKLELDLKAGTLDTDIKSLRKAARQSIGPEFQKRIKKIIDSKLIELKEDFKIYWEEFPIAKLLPGKDYLKPEFSLIVDEIIEIEEKKKLQFFLENWIDNKINLVFKSLINLKNSKENKSNIRALSYQLYENNGVVKRENVINYLNKLNQEERKILRNIGVKFGRYHIYLYKLLKPEAFSLRLTLWKNYHQKYYDFVPPKFGLNFLETQKKLNQNFMLICGFEKFDNFFVRIDILERLFIQIINSDNKKRNEIMLVPEMLNLLGCSKDNFIKLIKKMNYKSIEKENKVYFKYLPFRNNSNNNNTKKTNKDSPFSVLKELSIK